VPDTNALIRNPAVEDIATVVGSASYMVHIPTTVLSEMDDLKDRGRTPELREKAEKVIRRLKGLQDRGSLTEGVTLAGKVRLRLEHREVDARSVLSWLDPTVPDDRIVAAALRLQSDAEGFDDALVGGICLPVGFGEGVLPGLGPHGAVGRVLDDPARPLSVTPVRRPGSRNAR
jgi:predicted ribonuclease YlaK